MKNAILNKIAVIGLVLISLGMVPLYAADNKPVLKLQEAIDSGFTYSGQISFNSREKDLLRDRLKAGQDQSYVAYQTIYLKKAKNEQQAEVLKDKITYDITNRYNSLVLLEKEITKIEHNISLATKELGYMKLKQENGLVDSVQYKSMEISLEDLQNSKKAKLEQLDNNRSYFKLITGKDLTKYSLEDSLTYETFRIPGAVENYIDTKAKDYLKRDNELAQFAKDNILTDVNEVVYYSDYLEKNYNADKDLSDLEDTKKTMKQGLMNNYSSLLSLEDQISTLLTKQKLTQKQVDYAKIKYKAGMITQFDYEKEAFNLEEIDFNLRELITNYNSLKLVIQKPWADSST